MKNIKVEDILALIKLDGADTAFPHYIDGISNDEIIIGMRVEAVFKPKDQRIGSILDISHFRKI